MHARISLLFLLFSFFQHSIFAQTPDTTPKVAHLLRGGEWEGKLRTFGMATTNQGNLPDFHAWAVGGGIRYRTPLLMQHLRFELGGMFIYNLSSSDLGKPDSVNRVKDRYEIGLFDLENPDNRRDLDRMEEFNAQFEWNTGRITLGHQVINSPLINPQDGRMRPSLMSGLWADVKATKRLQLQGGWLWLAAPRSTVRWFSVAESIGVYQQGVNTEGGKNDYGGNLSSKGVFVLGSKTRISKRINVSAWNYWVENISNTVFVQTDFEKPIFTEGGKLKASAQIIRQDAVADGGNIDPKKTYVPKGSKAWILGGRIGVQVKKHTFLLNYTRITADGRFNFPREWGRDPLLTFMQRERNEGAGDVHAVNMTTSRETTDKRTRLEAGLGYYKMPDVLDFRLNKYGVPSYIQANLSARIRLKGSFEGLEVVALLAHKWNNGNTYNDVRYRANKVDMTNYNVVANYHF